MIAHGAKRHDKWDMKRYSVIFAVLVVCLILYTALIVIEQAGGAHYIFPNLLMGYSIFEFLSIIVSFSIFLIAFYTYYQSMNLRLVISGFTFLITGILDAFHMITIQSHFNLQGNESLAQISLTYMLISRLVSAIGFFLLVVVPEQKKNKVSRGLITILSAVFVMICYLLVSNNSTVRILAVEPNGMEPAGIIAMALIALIYAFNVFRAINDFTKKNDPLKKVLACAFIIMFFSQAISIQMTNLYDIRGVISNVFKFAAFILYFNLFYIHNIRRPYVLLSKAKEELNAYTFELDRLVDKRTSEFRQANERMMADLEVARGIQKAMLPTTFPQNDYISFTAGYVPAANLSGDFYNVFKIDETRYGVCIGDVSGHGVSAAMLTVFTFQKIQSLLEELGVAGMGIPSVVLKHLYDSFNAANFSEELYIVMLYGVYNVDTGIFSYASGGLNTTPLRLRPDGSIQELDSDGYAICKLGDLLKPKFVNHQIMLFPGDKLVLYTDGLVEAVDEKHEPYSKERLKEIISKNRKWNAERLTEIVMEDVGQYSHVVQDDVTILILDVLRPF